MFNSMLNQLTGSDAFELPSGYRAIGMHAGIKKDGVKDMALFVSDHPAEMAGTYTTNRFRAAPVELCIRHLNSGMPARAIVVNSGVANAATGTRGQDDARDMAERTAQLTGIETEQVYVCSTGVIGRYLPMDTVRQGIERMVSQLAADGGTTASEAILTTDTRPKRWSVEFNVDGYQAKLAGCAKGAGMIQPDMATMLAFLFTDAAVNGEALRNALRLAVADSFNRITVDGDTSTNDTTLMMANGCAGNKPLHPGHKDWDAFTAALEEVTKQLAWKIIEDGEGAEKVICIQVRGATSDADAERVARTIANSFLVKTGWSGKGPAWGRVLDCIGYSGADVDPAQTDVYYNDLPAVTGGISGAAAPEALASAVKNNFRLMVDLHRGQCQATVYTCNITEEYVRINL